MKPTKLEAVGSLLGNYSDLGYDPATDTMSYYRNQTPPTEKEIDTELARLQAEHDAQEYARNRASEYPSIPDQLDEIYHNGVDSWKAVIKVTKDKYPKG